MSRSTFVACLAAIAAVVVAQSAVHLVLAMGLDRPRTIVDVEHSNGVPDLVSSAILALGAVAALAIARTENGRQRVVALLTAGAFTVLTLADLLHDGAHPFRAGGALVVALVVATGMLVALIGWRGSRRSRITLAVAAVLLAGSFLTSGVDRFEAFDARRGEILKEGRLVTKEGLELVGWSLIALALWDEALRRRAASQPSTARASRAPAAQRQRAA